MSSFLIRGAMVIDGSGGEPVRADVAVKDELITDVSTSIKEGQRTIIDADGLVAAPGFIDIHSHTDLTIFKRPLAESKALQGVTTEVVGNCGIGAFPVNDQQAALLADYLEVHDFHLPPDGFGWSDFTQYAVRLDQTGLGINLVPLVAHGALRIAVLGMEDRTPNDEELARMKTLLAESFEQGAWGLSTGLIYPPGNYARTEELTDLAEIAARYGALYSSHIRGEGATLMQSLDEAVLIGKKSRVRVEVSHLKAIGKENWGCAKEALLKLERARQSGVDIAADQYPYEATSTSLTALVPQWAHAGGTTELLKRLASHNTADPLSAEIDREINERGGPDRIVIAELSSGENSDLSGKNLTEIAELWHCTPATAVMRLLIEEKAVVGAIYFSLSGEDVTTILSSDQVSVGSDGAGMNAGKDFLILTHPRSYGTFPRVLSMYVRERETLSISKAIHKMTGRNAERVGLRNRGLIKPGYIADLVLFDPLTIQDHSTFDQPHQYATGIIHTWVAGCAIVRDCIITGNTPGKVLRKKRPSPKEPA